MNPTWREHWRPALVLLFLMLASSVNDVKF
jgi:hypothetical protein